MILIFLAMFVAFSYQIKKEFRGKIYSEYKRCSIFISESILLHAFFSIKTVLETEKIIINR